MATILAIPGIQRIKRSIKRLVGLDVSATPDLSISSERLGGAYGGWSVALQYLQKPGSIVYSAGVGKDISFDLGLLSQANLELHAFDPTPVSAAWIVDQKLPSGMSFHPWGLSGVDGEVLFASPSKLGNASYSAVKQSLDGVACPVFTLKSLMRKLGHTSLDLLKMDIEGSEYGALDTMMRDALSPDQILVEFHHNLYGISVEATRAALSRMSKAGYLLYHISDGGREYSFIREEVYHRKSS